MSQITMEVTPEISKVFLIAQPSIRREDGYTPNLTPLAKYGEVVTLLEGGEYPSFKPGEALRRVLDRLSDFDAELDYIAWAGGDPLAAVLVGTALTMLGHRRYMWLRFERGHTAGKRTAHNGHYTPIEISLLV